MNYIFFSMIMINLLSAPALQAETSFTKANEHYRAGEFQQALHVYESIPQKDATIWYNIGNCFYRLNKKGHALLAWRRAEKVWGLFGKQELLHNISLIQQSSHEENEDDTARNYSFGRLRLALTSFFRSIPFTSLQVIFLFFWLLLWLTLRYVIQRRLYLSLLICSLIITGLLLMLRIMLNPDKYGIVVEKKASIYSGPGKTFQHIATLNEAEEIRIIKQLDGFYKIHTHSLTGWASMREIKKI